MPTAVWVARDGDSLIVTTVGSSGKVKRLRNNPRVQLAPASMSGKVAADAVWADATATVEAMTPEASSVMAAKYNLVYRFTGWMGRRRRADPAPRVILRIQ